MTKPGRPRQTLRPLVASIKLVLYPGQDDDLIDYLAAAGPRLRATLVKLAMREGMATKGALATQAAGAVRVEEEGFDAFDQLLQ
jgi:hypothetical protein